MPTTPLAPWTVRSAMFLVSMAALLLQIALTRVLSATASHHWAFAVIGLAMLGLAASASVLFVRRARGLMGGLAEAAAVSAGGGLAAALCSVTYPASTWLDFASLRQVPLMAMALLFFGLFFCAGYVIAFMLAEFADDASNLYWLDLTGAAAGCLAVVPLLDAASPLATVALSGAMLAVSGVLLGGPRFLPGSLATALAGIVTVAAFGSPTTTHLHRAKGVPQDDVIWESWNRLSRVTVQPDVPGYADGLRLLAERVGEAKARETLDRWRIGWGMSPDYQGSVPAMRWILLDSDAGTQIIGDGARDVGAPLEFLESTSIGSMKTAS